MIRDTPKLLVRHRKGIFPCQWSHSQVVIMLTLLVAYGVCKQDCTEIQWRREAIVKFLVP